MKRVIEYVGDSARFIKQYLVAYVTKFEDETGVIRIIDLNSDKINETKVLNCDEVEFHLVDWDRDLYCVNLRECCDDVGAMVYRIDLKNMAVTDSIDLDKLSAKLSVYLDKDVYVFYACKDGGTVYAIGEFPENEEDTEAFVCLEPERIKTYRPLSDWYQTGSAFKWVYIMDRQVIIDNLITGKRYRCDWDIDPESFVDLAYDIITVWERGEYGHYASVYCVKDDTIYRIEGLFLNEDSYKNCYTPNKSLIAISERCNDTTTAITVCDLNSSITVRKVLDGKHYQEIDSISLVRDKVYILDCCGKLNAIDLKEFDNISGSVQVKPAGKLASVENIPYTILTN